MLLFSLLLSSFVDRRATGQQENTAPVVKLVSPLDNSSFAWNTPIAYQITVADKEDGDSRYGEINAKEVVLEVRYIKDKAKLRAVLKDSQQVQAPGMTVIRMSNCFNCHNFNSKSIGPSFYEISKRYPASRSNLDSLVKHVQFGSSGIWVKEKMPSHPELSAMQIKEAVLWILKNSADPDVNYYNGLHGAFRIVPPQPGVKAAAYVLTASYTDHGLKSSPGKGRLEGRAVGIIGLK